MTGATLAEHEVSFEAIAGEVCSNVVGFILKDKDKDFIVRGPCRALPELEQESGLLVVLEGLKKMMQFLKTWPAEQAEALSEYVLVLILISLAALATMKGLETTVGHFFSSTSTRVETTGSHQSITTEPLPENNSVQTEGGTNLIEDSPDRN